jgi:hypothetical protein
MMSIPPLASGVFPVQVIPPAYCVGGEVRRVSGGSLEIMPSVVSGGSIGGATVPGVGYLIGSSQVLSWEGPAAFFLGASGSTCIASVLFKYAAGSTIC